MRKVITPLVMVAAAITLFACGGDDGTEASSVKVTLREWEVKAAPAEVKPGQVTFDLTNSGTRQHQFIVVKSDLPPGQLPALDVLVDETKVNITGSVKAIQPGESAKVELQVFPGKYVLICNLIDRPITGPADPHYLNGMAASFLVLDD